MNPLICITRETALLTDAVVQEVVDALQIQVTDDWAPAWGTGATLEMLSPGTPLPEGAWQLALLDNTDQAGDLGYHETTANGTPLGKVFIATDQHYGLNWTVTASHELLEMLGDPEANRTIGLNGVLYALEVCDPVEDEMFDYRIGSVFVSDFTLPRYWMPGAATGSYDRCGVLTTGMPTLLKGGYASVCENGVWTQKFGETSPHDRGRLERGFHRRKLRATPHSERRRSTR